MPCRILWIFFPWKQKLADNYNTGTEIIGLYVYRVSLPFKVFQAPLGWTLFPINLRFQFNCTLMHQHKVLFFNAESNLLKMFYIFENTDVNFLYTILLWISVFFKQKGIVHYLLILLLKYLQFHYYFMYVCLVLLMWKKSHI